MAGIAEWRNGGMAEWRNGGMAEEWQKMDKKWYIRTIYGTQPMTMFNLLYYLKPIGPAARESVNGGLLFFCTISTNIPYAGYRIVIGYGVTLLVTPPQAATKIIVGMAEWQKEWQNWRNGRNGYIRTIYGTRPTTRQRRRWHYDDDDTFRMSYWHLVEQLWTLRSGVAAIWKNHVFSTGKEHPNRIRITAGGNLINYDSELLVWTADINTAKLHWNSVVSMRDAEYMCLDIKNFYLTVALENFEYMRIPLELFLSWINKQYNLTTHV